MLLLLIAFIQRDSPLSGRFTELLSHVTAEVYLTVVWFFAMQWALCPSLEIWLIKDYIIIIFFKRQANDDTLKNNNLKQNGC